MADVDAMAAELEEMKLRQGQLIDELKKQRSAVLKHEQDFLATQQEITMLKATDKLTVLQQQLGGSVVDTRTLGKPEKFAGRREGWRQFRFVFEAFACASHANMAELFRESESMGDKQIDLDGMDEQKTTLSRQLYYMLVMLTSDDAQSLVGNVDQGNGAEAWRRLCWEYEPNVKVRHGAVLHALLRREFGKDVNGDLAVEIERFEKDVRRYEDQSGRKLDDDVKMSILIGGMQNTKVKDHLELNASRLEKYAQMRNEVINFAVARRTWTTPEDDPMMIGAVPSWQGGWRSWKGGKGDKGKYGKGDPKGKGSKSQKGDPKGGKSDKGGRGKGGRAKDHLYYNGYYNNSAQNNGKGGKDCQYCKKGNHAQRDCWKLRADIAAGKVDKNGREITNTTNSVTPPKASSEGDASSSQHCTTLALPAPISAAYPGYSLLVPNMPGATMPMHSVQQPLSLIHI